MGPDSGFPELVDIDAALAQQAEGRSGGGQGSTLLIMSMLLFFGSQQVFSDAPWTFFGLLVVVLLIHELGHLAAMRLFGFSDLRMFFIPFFGVVYGIVETDLIALVTTQFRRALVVIADRELTLVRQAQRARPNRFSVSRGRKPSVDFL